MSRINILYCLVLTIMFSSQSYGQTTRPTSHPTSRPTSISPKVRKLLKKLRTGSVTQKRLVMAELSNMGKQAIPAIPTLQKHLEGKSVPLRIGAAYTLSRLGEEGLYALIVGLKSPNPQVKQTIMWFRGRYQKNNQAAVKALRRAAKHKNKKVRTFAKGLLSSFYPKKPPKLRQDALHIPTLANVYSLDPITFRNIHDHQLAMLVTEPLLEYHYFKRPYTLQPLLLKTLPKISKDGKIYTFELKRGIRFQDNPCFPKGKGRELIAKDVVYSYKRAANRHYRPQIHSWWVFNQRIVDFDAYRERQSKRIQKGFSFNYNAPVKGLQVLGRYRFRIHLKKPAPRFLYLLAMIGIVPQEAVNYYNRPGKGGFSRNPVGTGPFVLKKWRWGSHLIFKRNPHYKHATYPSTGFSKQDIQLGHHLDKGKRLPRTDLLIVHPPTAQRGEFWELFKKRKLAFVPLESSDLPNLLNKKGKLLRSYHKKGYRLHKIQELEFTTFGFGMNAPVLGGKSQKARYLRKAIYHAIDVDALNHKIHGGTKFFFKGIIPPGLTGYAGKFPKANLKLVKKYLKKAGYPDGKGSPLFHLHVYGQSPGAKLIQEQLADAGIRVRLAGLAHPKALQKGGVQIFPFSWMFDYPDAENGLQVFWDKNIQSGSNYWNYNSSKYNKLLMQVRVLPASPKRRQLLVKMNQMLIDDALVFASMCSSLYYLGFPDVKNFKPPRRFLSNYWKYLRK